MGNSATIIADHLTKVYADKTAVDNLDLEVVDGSISCLLGPNGSGKTTTVAMLTTLRTPASGKALVCGYDTQTHPDTVRGLIGVALQHTGLDDIMTGRETLELQGTLQGLSGAELHRRCAELIDLVDLGGHIDTKLGTWSGGLRRRMDLAAALVHEPRVLFLDEPTTGLDPASRRDIWEEIVRLNKEEGTTVLLTTQQLEEADHLADTVTILHEGRHLVTATPEDLKQRLGDRSMNLVLADEEAADVAENILARAHLTERPSRDAIRIPVNRHEPASVIATLVHEGIGVVAMTVTEPTLEDVFLELTKPVGAR